MPLKMPDMAKQNARPKQVLNVFHVSSRELSHLLGAHSTIASLRPCEDPFQYLVLDLDTFLTCPYGLPTFAIH